MVTNQENFRMGKSRRENVIWNDLAHFIKRSFVYQAKYGRETSGNNDEEINLFFEDRGRYDSFISFQLMQIFYFCIFVSFLNTEIMVNASSCQQQ